MSASAPSYTTCFDYHPPDKPFSKSTDMPALFLNHGAAGAVFGIIAGLAAGLVIGGPIGAVAGALVGAFVGGYVAVATAIKEGAQQWLHHRLVCLTGDVCAVGQIKSRPEVSDLGEFDNDEWFNLALMPFPHDPAYEILADATKPETMAAQAALSAHPGNRPLDDRFQGKKLLAPRPDLLTDLGYCKGGDEEGAHDPNQISRNWLHVEAEGDFWVRMDDLAAALGLLAGVEAAGVVGAAIAGGVEGCAIGGFLGIIGCVIGAIIGAIVAAALAAAAAAAVTKAVLQGVFDTEKGNVEDANVDDTPLGELIPGDMVAVYGRHVYDGFHAGWHEMHPLLKICRIPPNTDKEGKDHPLYLRWAPDFFDADTPPTFALPGEQIPDLESGDMRNGLDSDRFLAWCEAIRRHWCRHLGVSEEPHVKRDQLRPEHRWTIHPLVDGCLPTLDPGDPHLPDPGPH